MLVSVAIAFGMYFLHKRGLRRHGRKIEWCALWIKQRRFNRTVLKT